MYDAMQYVNCDGDDLLRHRDVGRFARAGRRRGGQAHGVANAGS